jgi:hypothetical protein
VPSSSSFASSAHSFPDAAMLVPDIIVHAAIGDLQRSLAADDKILAEAILAAAALDSFISQQREMREDKAHLIEQLIRIAEHDPQTRNTPRPPPLPPAPPGMRIPARRLTPPIRGNK